MKARGEAAAAIDLSAAGGKVKRETDWTLGLAPMPSVSATWDEVDNLDAVLRGEAGVASLATEPELVEQAIALGPHEEGLFVYGPIPSLTRKHVSLAVADDVAIEVWTLPDCQLVELSAKVDGDGAAMGEALRVWCEQAQVRSLDRSKTRFALSLLLPTPLRP